MQMTALLALSGGAATWRLLLPDRNIENCPRKMMWASHRLRMIACAVKVLQTNNKVEILMRSYFMPAVVIGTGVEKTRAKCNALGRLIGRIDVSEFRLALIYQERSFRQPVHLEHSNQGIDNQPKIAVERNE